MLVQASQDQLEVAHLLLARLPGPLRHEHGDDHAGDHRDEGDARQHQEHAGDATGRARRDDVAVADRRDGGHGPPERIAEGPDLRIDEVDEDRRGERKRSPPPSTIRTTAFRSVSSTRTSVDTTFHPLYMHRDPCSALEAGGPTGSSGAEQRLEARAVRLAVEGVGRMRVEVRARRAGPPGADVHRRVDRPVAVHLDRHRRRVLARPRRRSARAAGSRRRGCPPR